MTIQKDVFLNELKNFEETGEYDFIKEKLTEEEVWKFAFLVTYILGENIKEELTEKEKEFLTMIFKMSNVILESCENEIRLEVYENFHINDLFDLAQKLGIKY